MTKSLTVANRWNQSHCANDANSRRSLTVKHNSRSTEISLLDVITYDLKALYFNRYLFFHPRTGFISVFCFCFFNTSLTPFHFHPISSWDHLQRLAENTPWTDFSEGSGPSPTSKAFLFTSLGSVNTTHSHLLSASNMESFMLLCWHYDWFVSLLFMELSRQMCRIINTVGKDALFLLRVGYINVHGMRL